jgi:hypothetical protein
MNLLERGSRCQQPRVRAIEHQHIGLKIFCCLSHARHYLVSVFEPAAPFAGALYQFVAGAQHYGAYRSHFGVLPASGCIGGGEGMRGSTRATKGKFRQLRKPCGK